MSTPGGYLQRTPHPSSLYDVLDLILDKGLVIDLYVRATVLGIELLTVDARIVVASVDTYLRFAEAVNRLDLDETGGRGLPELASDMVEKVYETGAKAKTKGAVDDLIERTAEQAKDAIERILPSGDDPSS